MPKAIVYILKGDNSLLAGVCLWGIGGYIPILQESVTNRSKFRGLRIARVLRVNIVL